jgi:hypothetical protein
VRPRTIAITTGAVFALALTTMSGCSSDQEYDAEFTEICQDANGYRVPDQDCEDSSDGSHFVYIPRSSGYHPPAVGARIDPTKGTTIRPAGYAVARAPITGGFGRTSTAGS